MRGGKEAAADLDLVGGAAEKTGHALRGIAGIAFGGLAAFAGFEGLKSAVENTQKLAVSASALAKVTGMNVNTSAQWLSVTNAFGISTRTLTMSMKTLSTQTESALSGTKKSREAFKAMGITTDELKKHTGSMNDLLGFVSDKFNAMPGGVKKTQVASQLLGRGWQQLIPLLSEGSKGMDDLRKTAAAYGVTLGKDPLENARKLHEAEIKLHLAQTGMEVQIAEKLAPAFILLFNKALAVYQAIRQNLGPVIQWVGGLIGKAAHVFTAGGVSLGGFGTTANHVFTSIKNAVMSTWTSLRRAFSQIAAAARQTFSGSFVRDLSVVGQQLLKFGGIVARVFGWIIKLLLPSLVTVVRGGFQIIAGIVKVLAGVLTLDFGKAWSGVKDIFGGAIKLTLGILQAAVAPFKAAGDAIWNGLKSGLVAVINWIIDTIRGIADTVNSITSSIPLIGGNVIDTSGLVHVGGGGGPVVTGTVPVRKRGLNYSTPGHQGAQVRSNAMFGSGDVVIRVGPHELARVQKHALWNAMAANA